MVTRPLLASVEPVALRLKHHLISNATERKCIVSRKHKPKSSREENKREGHKEQLLI